MNIKGVLGKFGIDLNKMRKTEKTINEMNFDINFNFKLSNKFEKTEKLRAISQAADRYNGIANLGNSCYINSVVQVLASISDFKKLCVH